MKTKELRLLIKEELAKELKNSSLITPINEKLDPVGKEDDDVDNDGDSDESDEYLKKKRAAISKAVKNETKLTSIVNEGFATWKMQFAKMNLDGVQLDPKKTYTVKARSTVEAIKKASKQAGLSGNSWMATQTHKLIKV